MRIVTLSDHAQAQIDAILAAIERARVRCQERYNTGYEAAERVAEAAWRQVYHTGPPLPRGPAAEGLSAGGETAREACELAERLSRRPTSTPHSPRVRPSMITATSTAFGVAVASHLLKLGYIKSPGRPPCSTPSAWPSSGVAVGVGEGVAVGVGVGVSVGVSVGAAVVVGVGVGVGVGEDVATGVGVRAGVGEGVSSGVEAASGMGVATAVGTVDSGLSPERQPVPTTTSATSASAARTHTTSLRRGVERIATDSSARRREEPSGASAGRHPRTGLGAERVPPGGAA